MKYLALGLIAVGFLLSAVAYPKLPQMMPTHWNFQGEINGYAPKIWGAWFPPVLALVFWFLFEWLPSADPKKEKYRLFAREWRIIEVGIIGFLIYVHWVVLYLVKHPEAGLLPFLFLGMGALFILMGNYLSKIRQNYFIGIKVPWTLNDEDNWNKTHRYASWWFVGAGLVTVFEALRQAQGSPVEEAPGVIFGALIVATVVPIVYSYLLYKKATEKMRYVYVGLGVLVLVLVILRGVSGEDDWICERKVQTDGTVTATWVAHGRPDSSKPTVPCKP